MLGQPGYFITEEAIYTKLSIYFFLFTGFMWLPISHIWLRVTCNVKNNKNMYGNIKSIEADKKISEPNSKIQHSQTRGSIQHLGPRLTHRVLSSGLTKGQQGCVPSDLWRDGIPEGGCYDRKGCSAGLCQLVTL